MPHILATVPPSDFANGFGIALGFIAFIVITIFIALGIDAGHLKNPFNPFIRWIDRWVEHRCKMSELKMRLKLKRDDPDYVEYLEKKGELD